MCPLNFFKRIQVLPEEGKTVSLVQEVQRNQSSEKYGVIPEDERQKWLTCNLLW